MLHLAALSFSLCTAYSGYHHNTKRTKYKHTHTHTHTHTKTRPTDTLVKLGIVVCEEEGEKLLSNTHPKVAWTYLFVFTSSPPPSADRVEHTETVGGR
uniref:Putative secreted protein n=1 Tax=Anopheles marajoara TaxID=58244 RepID=A0A2M4C8Y8_9DIPT